MRRLSKNMTVGEYLFGASKSYFRLALIELRREGIYIENDNDLAKHWDTLVKLAIIIRDKISFSKRTKNTEKRHLYNLYEK